MYVHKERRARETVVCRQVERGYITRISDSLILSDRVGFTGYMHAI